MRPDAKHNLKQLNRCHDHQAPQRVDVAVPDLRHAKKQVFTYDACDTTCECGGRKNHEWTRVIVSGHLSALVTACQCCFGEPGLAGLNHSKDCLEASLLPIWSATGHRHASIVNRTPLQRRRWPTLPLDQPQVRTGPCFLLNRELTRLLVVGQSFYHCLRPARHGRMPVQTGFPHVVAWTTAAKSGYSVSSTIRDRQEIAHEPAQGARPKTTAASRFRR